MSLTVRDGAMLGAGMTLVAASTFFYRRKQTLPFKVALSLTSSPSSSKPLSWAQRGTGSICRGIDFHAATHVRSTATVGSTRPQVAYFLSWPVLGTAVILAWQPSPGEMSHMVKDSGIANESQLQAVRILVQAQVALRKTAQAERASWCSWVLERQPGAYWTVLIWPYGRINMCIDPHDASRLEQMLMVSRCGGLR